jgi:MYXO-CTERM domain-containing protein
MSTGPGAGVRGRSAWPAAPATALVVGLWLAPLAAEANVVPVYFEGGTGGSVLPRGTDSVRIVSEHLEFVEGTQETSPPSEDFCRWLPWHVRADYVLENVTDERVELDVGFPFEGQRGEEVTLVDQSGEDFRPGGWRGGRDAEPFKESFHARLDGTDLRHRLTRNRCPSRTGGGARQGPRCYPYVFLFRIAVDARARVPLTIEYDQEPSTSGDDSRGLDVTVPYILETGASWTGTIGEMEIVYRFAVPPIPYGGNRAPNEDGVVLDFGAPWEERRLGPTGDPPQWYPTYAPPAPAGVVELWDPAVRFEYAFVCEDERIVLRLRAADFEPGGDISLVTPTPSYRLDALWMNASCAVVRSREGVPPDAWSSWSDSAGKIDAPPPEFRCSLAHGESVPRAGGVLAELTTEYRFDCCCAAAAATVPWFPRVNAAGADDADGGEAGIVLEATDGTEGDAVPDAVAPDFVPDTAGPAIADAMPMSSADVSGAPSGSATGTAAAIPPSVSTPGGRDASAAPANPRPKKGCGCSAAGAGGSTWWGLAVLDAPFLVRLRRRRPSS